VDERIPGRENFDTQGRHGNINRIRPAAMVSAINIIRMTTVTAARQERE
jgi:hypothetical protein